MVGPVIDVSPKTSSRYQLPDFSPIAQSGMFMGQQFSQGLNKLGDQMRKRKQKAKIGSLFEQHGDDWSAINQALFADPSIRMDDNFWKIMGHGTGRQDAAQAQSNTDRNYGLSAERVQLERERANMSREEFEFRKGQIARQEAAAAEAAANAVPDVKVQNFVNPATGEMQAFDLNTHEGVAGVREAIANNWIETNQTNVDATGLTRGAKTEIQKTNLDLKKSIGRLESIKGTMDPDMLTTIQKYAGKGLGAMQRSGVPLSPEQEEALYAQELFSANVYSYQNYMLNMLSGAAVSEQEYDRIKRQLPTVDDSKSSFMAKFDSSAANAERAINDANRALYGDSWEDIRLPRYKDSQGKGTMSTGEALGDMAGDVMGAVGDAVVPAANAATPPMDFTSMSNDELGTMIKDPTSLSTEQLEGLINEFERRRNKQQAENEQTWNNMFVSP